VRVSPTQKRDRKAQSGPRPHARHLSAGADAALEGEAPEALPGGD
jgi:hypothetical protein